MELVEEWNTVRMEEENSNWGKEGRLREGEGGGLGNIGSLKLCSLVADHDFNRHGMIESKSKLRWWG